MLFRSERKRDRERETEREREGRRRRPGRRRDELTVEGLSEERERGSQGGNAETKRGIVGGAAVLYYSMAHPGG